MKNKGIDPIFVSALDILTGALGAFIVLNFLQARQPRLPEQAQATAKEIAAEQKQKTNDSKASADRNGQNDYRYDQRYRQGGAYEKPYEQAPSQAPNTPQTTETPNPTPNVATQEERAPSQDPVAVDLLKQTKGAMAFLLQQADQSKSTVEYMIRQGSREWKAGRATKYQDEVFQYQKGINYFYQNTVQPGSYEIMVRVKKSSRAVGMQNFALFGKLIPPGQRARSYNFGSYGLHAAATDWTRAGTLTIAPSGLSFQPSLLKATEVKPGAETPVVNTPASTPQPEAKPKKKTGKWG